MDLVYLALADKYGQVVGNNNEAKVSVRIDATFVSGENGDQLYAPILEGSTVFDSKGGAFLVNGITFAASPGYTYKLVFETDAINPLLPSNQEYLSKLGGKSVNFPITVNLREC